MLLAGATGTIGKPLVARLREAGHTVIGISRSATGAEWLEHEGATAIHADVLDRVDLLRAVAGTRADAVIHQATALKGLPVFHRDLHATDRLRDEGTSALVEAAQRIGATRFVTQSFFLGYGYRDLGEDLVTEETEFGQSDRNRAVERHLASMRTNESLVRTNRSFDGIALRFGMFYGPEPSTRELLSLAAKGWLPVPKPSGTVSLIHIYDAAEATVAALEQGKAGEAYNICDDLPVSFSAYISALANQIGARRPAEVPGWLLKPASYLHAMIVDTRVRMGNEKAKAELGWSPTYSTYREGLARTL
ncbi:SDR family oxidoreductase [Brevibacterium marinum]